MSEKINDPETIIIEENTTLNKQIDIYLFDNGQNDSPPRKYHLAMSDLHHHWEITLSLLARIHYGALHNSPMSLYDLAGHKIQDPNDLTDGGFYVAVVSPDQFIKTGYHKYLTKATKSMEKRYSSHKEYEGYTNGHLDLNLGHNPASVNYQQPLMVYSQKSLFVQTKKTSLPDKKLEPPANHRPKQNANPYQSTLKITTGTTKKKIPTLKNKNKLSVSVAAKSGSASKTSSSSKPNSSSRYSPFKLDNNYIKRPNTGKKYPSYIPIKTFTSPNSTSIRAKSPVQGKKSILIRDRSPTNKRNTVQTKLNADLSTTTNAKRPIKLETLPTKLTDDDQKSAAKNVILPTKLNDEISKRKTDSASNTANTDHTPIDNLPVKIIKYPYDNGTQPQQNVEESKHNDVATDTNNAQFMTQNGTQPQHNVEESKHNDVATDTNNAQFILPLVNIPELNNHQLNDYKRTSDQNNLFTENSLTNKKFTNIVPEESLKKETQKQEIEKETVFSPRSSAQRNQGSVDLILRDLNTPSEKLFSNSSTKQNLTNKLPEESLKKETREQEIEKVTVSTRRSSAQINRDSENLVLRDPNIPSNKRFSDNLTDQKLTNIVPEESLKKETREQEIEKVTVSTPRSSAQINRDSVDLVLRDLNIPSNKRVYDSLTDQKLTKIVPEESLKKETREQEIEKDAVSTPPAQMYWDSVDLVHRGSNALSNKLFSDSLPYQKLTNKVPEESLQKVTQKQEIEEDTVSTSRSLAEKNQGSVLQNGTTGKGTNKPSSSKSYSNGNKINFSSVPPHDDNSIKDSKYKNEDSGGQRLLQSSKKDFMCDCQDNPLIFRRADNVNDIAPNLALYYILVPVVPQQIDCICNKEVRNWKASNFPGVLSTNEESEIPAACNLYDCNGQSTFMQNPCHEEVVVNTNSTQVDMLGEAKSFANKSTQTEWCDTLVRIEAYEEMDGRFKFYLPTLTKLKEYIQKDN